MNMMRLSGRVAVITGAGGGIGRAIALSLARRGCHLALCDIDVAGLAVTIERVRDTNIHATCHRLDVADREAVADLPGRIAAEHGRADLLVNNAGVALGGRFEQVSEADFDWLFAINFFGVVRMTRAFLPMLRASDDARILNLSSLFGIIAPPGQAAYAASKFAVRGFSQALRHELAGTSVGITVAHPGGVRTGIARNARRPAAADPQEAAREAARFERLLSLSPERAGETIVAAAERRRARILVGRDAKLASIVERIMPVSYWKLIGRMAQ